METGTGIEIVAASGALRVTVRPRPRWFEVLMGLGISVIIATILYRGWATLGFFYRVILIAALVADVLVLIFRLTGTVQIVFDEQNLCVTREIHGWERTKEYAVKDCARLRWTAGSDDVPPSLGCKVGWKTKILVQHLSEQQADEIIEALWKHLPDVARKITSDSDPTERFIALGLPR